MKTVYFVPLQDPAAYEVTLDMLWTGIFSEPYSVAYGVTVLFYHQILTL